MKKILSIALAAFLLVASCSGCGSSKTKEITAENFHDYFFITTKTDTHYPPLETTADGAIVVAPKMYTANIKVTIDTKKELNANSVVIKGNIDLPEKEWRTLHKEEILPFETTIKLDSEGHGEYTKEFMDWHWYNDDDFFFECTSASGSITLK